MTLELGVYSFGNTATSTGGDTAQAIRNVLESVHVAGQPVSPRSPGTSSGGSYGTYSP